MRDRIPAPDEDILGSISKNKSKPKKSKQIHSKPGKKARVDVFLIALIAILLIVVVYTALTLPKGETEIVNNDTEVVINQTNDSNNMSEEAYLLGLAIAEKNATLCEQLVEKQQDCYEALAMQVKEACLDVDDYSKRKDCILYFVQQEDSTSLCNQLNEEDELECGLLIDPCYGKVNGERDVCLAIEFGNYSYCETDACYYEYVKETRDKTVCGLFEELSRETACYSIAERKDLCQDLAMISQVDHCYYAYAVYHAGSFYCEKISTDSIYQYMCYWDFTLDEEDYSYCGKINDLNNRWKCYKNYALETGDLTGCQMISIDAKYNYEECYFNFAVDYSLPELCNKLNNPTSQYNCYGQAIMNCEKELPVDSCANITDESFKDTCYRYSAAKNQKLSICNKIQSASVKELCEYYLQDTEGETGEETCLRMQNVTA